MLALLAPAFAGCREPLGPPERFVTTTVSGVVLEGGEPVGGGWIELIPVDGTVGDTRSARLDDKGRFRADGVPVGHVALRLVNAPYRIPQLAQVFAPFSTPIRRRVASPFAGPIRVELMDELAGYRANQPRRRALDPALEPTRPDTTGGAFR